MIDEAKLSSLLARYESMVTIQTRKREDLVMSLPSKIGVQLMTSTAAMLTLDVEIHTLEDMASSLREAGVMLRNGR